MAWEIRGTLGGASSTAACVAAGKVGPAAVRSRVVEFMRTHADNTLEMSPTGPFVTFDPTDDVHVAQAFRQLATEITKDTAPPMEWPVLKPRDADVGDVVY